MNPQFYPGQGSFPVPGSRANDPALTYFQDMYMPPLTWISCPVT